MASQPNVFLTAEEYLDLEEKAEYKSEYMDGERLAMAGASPEHDTIVVNLVVSIGHQLKGSPCKVHSSDMRVAVSSANAYTYPDVSICCEDARYVRRGSGNLLNPVVIIEVLSPSTELYDRRKKFRMYKEIPSLKEYVLVSQDEVLVERFARQPNAGPEGGLRHDGAESRGRLRLNGADWLYSSLSSLDDSLKLHSVHVTLTLRDVYDRIFPSVEQASSSQSS